jgi:hypothetical protein
MNDNQATAETASPDTYRRLVGRLPVTLRPSLNQQLSEWEMLFPFERNRVAIFMDGVETFSPSALDALTARLRALESKMGVKQWKFSEDIDTIENASQLARSAYYVEWRREVERVFEAFNAAARTPTRIQKDSTRFILLVLPANLPLDPQTIWREWDPRGQEIKISGGAERICELAMQGQPGLSPIAPLLAGQSSVEASNLWLIDAEGRLNAMLSSLASAPLASSLSYAALKPFRDKFLAELNKAPKSIQITDEVVANLRRESWDGWNLWPSDLTGQPRLRKFVIDLFLSGNGALIFSNAFVEWTASEALRRARPRAIVARFGMRSKPKPFTSIAIFENQQRISSLPDVDDPENSAIDALILARYVWLSASRYPEHEQTICLCVSEFRNTAYLIAPAGKSPKWIAQGLATPEDICSWIAEQITA